MSLSSGRLVQRDSDGRRPDRGQLPRPAPVSAAQATTCYLSSSRSDFAVTESSRAFLAKPRDVEYELVAYAQERDHLQNAPPFAQAAAEPSADCTAPRHALRVRFSLPSGTYATMALRELLRVDLSKQAQRKAAEERASAGAGADENAKTEAGDDQNVKMDCGDAKEDATKVSTDDHKE